MLGTVLCACCISFNALMTHTGGTVVILTQLSINSVFSVSISTVPAQVLASVLLSA